MKLLRKAHYLFQNKSKMKKLVLINFCSIILFFKIGFCQQLSHQTGSSGSQLLQNPAAIDLNEKISIGISHLSQFSSYPLRPNQFYLFGSTRIKESNSAIGLELSNDQNGLLTQTTFKLKYSYKLKEIIASEDVLSLGISSGVHMNSINSSNLIAYHLDDVALQNIDQKKVLQPQLGFGFVYRQNQDHRHYKREGIQLHFSVEQLAFNDLKFNNDKIRSKQNVHIFTGIEYALLFDKINIMPTVLFDLTENSNLFHVGFQSWYDQNIAFDLFYRTNAQINLGLGYRFFLPRNDRYLFIGAQAAYGLKSVLEQGINYGITVQYLLKN